MLIEVGDLANERRVAGRGHADRLRKDGGVAGRGDAVQAFVPPIVLAYAQPRDRRRVVDQLRGLFLQRHARDEVRGARLGAQADVTVGKRRRIALGEGPRTEAGAGEQSNGHQGQAHDEAGTSGCVFGNVSDMNDPPSMRAHSTHRNPRREFSSLPRAATLARSLHDCYLSV